MISCICVMYWL